MDRSYARVLDQDEFAEFGLAISEGFSERYILLCFEVKIRI